MKTIAIRSPSPKLRAVWAISFVWPSGRTWAEGARQRAGAHPGLTHSKGRVKLARPTSSRVGPGRSPWPPS